MSTEIIADFRSDTVTRPGPEMRRAMHDAEVGDDVYGDDPTVNRLEAVMAERTGMEAALFVPTGTQSNLLALMSHCQRGEEYIAGQEAHVYKYEAGGAAVLGSIQPQPVEFEADGSLDLAKVAAKIKPRDSHFARTRLLCLENTQGGKVLSLAYQRSAREFARAHGLALHLDGARVFNAAVAQDVALTDITGAYDSVSVCLSKGLGAPVGSLLCGSKDLIDDARRWRKMVGGGMRQAGILAAAGLYAIDHQVQRLAEDHHHGRLLAEGLTELPGAHCDPARLATNMCYLTLDSDELATGLRQHLATQGIIIGAGRDIRLVTHLDIDEPAIRRTINACREYLG